MIPVPRDGQRPVQREPAKMPKYEGEGQEDLGAMKKLPSEMFEHIISFLEDKDKASLMEVNTMLKDFVIDQSKDEGRKNIKDAISTITDRLDPKKHSAQIRALKKIKNDERCFNGSSLLEVKNSLHHTSNSIALILKDLSPKDIEHVTEDINLPYLKELIDIYQDLDKADPSEAGDEEREQIAERLLNLGYINESIDLIKNTNTNGPPLSEFTKALTLLNEEQKALALCDELEDDQRKHALAGVLKGFCAQGKVTEAFELAKKSPNHASHNLAYSSIARELTALGNHDGAKRAASKILDPELKSQVLLTITNNIATDGDIKEASSLAKKISNKPLRNSANSHIAKTAAAEGNFTDSYKIAAKIKDKKLYSETMARIYLDNMQKFSEKDLKKLHRIAKKIPDKGISINLRKIISEELKEG